MVGIIAQQQRGARRQACGQTLGRMGACYTSSNGKQNHVCETHVGHPRQLRPKYNSSTLTQNASRPAFFHKPLTRRS
jgi:hypothetical protein